MTRLIILMSTLALSLVTLAASAAAKPALKDVASVREGIIAVGIAYEISQQCDSIQARTLRGLTYLNQLKNHAKSLGYSDAEIEAYVDDRTEQRRLEAIARARLADMGVVEGERGSYCTVGRDLMASGSAAGRLLR